MASRAAAAPPGLVFSATDRVLVLAPHPDDESLGCGGVLHDAVAAGVPAHVAFLTNGDANELSFLVWQKHPVVTRGGALTMGRLRGQEAVRAATALGLPADAVTLLGYPDAGTMPMWTDGWGAAPPHRSLITRVSAVPYETALRPGAAYKPAEVIRDLQTVLRRVRPTRVFVSHPADAHSDHRAWYVYARAALWETPELPAPTIHPFLIHHAHWPTEAINPPATPLEPPPLLGSEIAWMRRPLTAGAQEAKRRALEAHATQMAYSKRFMLGFVRANELYGDFSPAALRRPGDHADLLAGPVASGLDPRAEPPLAVRESFVGIEWRRAERVDDTLLATVELSRRLLPGTHAVLHFFGARPGRPFADMPKIRVEVSAAGHHVRDQAGSLSSAQVIVRRDGHFLTVTVPLALLGRPERLLAGAETIVAEFLMHPAPWHVVELGG